MKISLCVILLLGSFFSVAEATTEYHVYYIRGGNHPNDGQIDSSYIFWANHLYHQTSNIKQAVFHNFDNRMCDMVAENYWKAAEDGKSVKLALIGFSWGGPEALYVSRCLQQYSIRVNLVITLDSIIKFLIGPSSKVPSNVDLAINFFSRENGTANLFNVKTLRAESEHTTIYNQRIDGEVNHAIFPTIVEDCVLNILFNFIKDYSIKNKVCVPNF